MNREETARKTMESLYGTAVSPLEARDPEFAAI